MDILLDSEGDSVCDTSTNLIGMSSSLLSKAPRPELVKPIALERNKSDSGGAKQEIRELRPNNIMLVQKSKLMYADHEQWKDLRTVYTTVSQTSTPMAGNHPVPKLNGSM